MFVDSHCHLNFPKLAERLPEVLQTMRTNQVTHALCVSVDLESFPQVLALAQEHAHLFASVGVHPDGEYEGGASYEPSIEEWVERLVPLAQHPKVVAIGETGLDYYRLEGRSIDEMEWQRIRFRAHIRAARIVKKPLIIHTRCASEDTIRLMEEEGANEVGGVMHCFTESWQVAVAAMALNFYISLSGIVTFKNAEGVHELAQRVPLERLLIETDSPYLAPVPYRGKVNEPGLVMYVAHEIAALRGVEISEIAKATTHNFFNLFKISPF